MNKQRRRQITEVVERLTAIVTEIEIIQGDEQEALENLPESLQESDRAEAMQTSIDSLADALDLVEQLETTLNEASE